jgi:acyl-CoA thioesterase
MICGSGRQTISRPTFVGEPEPTLVPTPSTLIRRSLVRVGFAISSLSTTVRFLETELGAIAWSLYRIEGPRTTWTKSSGRSAMITESWVAPVSGM